MQYKNRLYSKKFNVRRVIRGSDVSFTWWDVSQKHTC